MQTCPDLKGNDDSIEFKKSTRPSRKRREFSLALLGLFFHSRARERHQKTAEKVRPCFLLFFLSFGSSRLRYPFFVTKKRRGQGFFNAKIRRREAAEGVFVPNGRRWILLKTRYDPSASPRDDAHRTFAIGLKYLRSGTRKKPSFAGQKTRTDDSP